MTNPSPNIKTRMYTKKLLSSGQSIKTPINKKSPRVQNILKPKMGTSTVRDGGNIYSVNSNECTSKVDKIVPDHTSVAVGTDGKMPQVISVMGNEWISDDHIQIYFDLINDKVLGNLPMCLINPVIVQAVKCLLDYDDVVVPLELHKKDFILLPINDSKSIKMEVSGGHWSLLVYVRAHNRFYYFDSIGDRNLSEAYEVVGRLSRFVNPVLSDIPLIQRKTPQQNNGIDCGVYVIMITEFIVSRILSNTSEIIDINFLFALPDFGQLDIWNKRAQMASIVYNLDRGCMQLNTIIPMLIKSSGRLSCDIDNNKGLNHNELQEKINTLEKNIASYNNKLAEQKKIIDAFDLTTDNVECREALCLDERNNKMPDSLPKLTVFCDSQGRNLSWYLGDINGEKYNMFNYTQPGAPLETIISSATDKLNEYTKRDYIVIIGGTNNINNSVVYGSTSCLNEFSAYLTSQVKTFEHTNLIISTIPYRYDRREDSRENKFICVLNCLIRNIAYTHSHVYLLDLHLLQRCHHTRHGLHVNKRGKHYISRQICDIVNRSTVIVSYKKSEPNAYLKAEVAITKDINKSALPSPMILTNKYIPRTPVAEQNKNLVDELSYGINKPETLTSSVLSETASPMSATSNNSTVQMVSTPTCYQTVPTKLSESKTVCFPGTSASSSPNFDTSLHGFSTPDCTKLNSFKHNFLVLRNSMN